MSKEKEGKKEGRVQEKFLKKVTRNLFIYLFIFLSFYPLDLFVFRFFLSLCIIPFNNHVSFDLILQSFQNLCPFTSFSVYQLLRLDARQVRREVVAAAKQTWPREFSRVIAVSRQWGMCVYVCVCVYGERERERKNEREEEERERQNKVHMTFYFKSLFYSPHSLSLSLFLRGARSKMELRATATRPCCWAGIALQSKRRYGRARGAQRQRLGFFIVSFSSLLLSFSHSLFLHRLYC